MVSELLCARYLAIPTEKADQVCHWILYLILLPVHQHPVVFPLRPLHPFLHLHFLQDTAMQPSGWPLSLHRWQLRQVQPFALYELDAGLAKGAAALDFSPPAKHCGQTLHT